MTSGWTAPGAIAPEPTPERGSGPSGTDPGRTDHAAGATHPADGPRRELDVTAPLFPLRPLAVGEILGGAVRIYRLRPRPVLALSAAVYGVAFVLITLLTGAGMVPMVGQLQATLEDPTGEVPVSSDAAGLVGTLVPSLLTAVLTLVATAVVTAVLARIAIEEAVGADGAADAVARSARELGPRAVAVSAITSLASVLALAVPAALGALPLVLTGSATLLTVALLAAGVLVGILAAVYVWARFALAVPALVVERLGVRAAVGRAWVLTRGRRQARVIGIVLLLTLVYTVATQTVAGVAGAAGFVAFMAVVLATSMSPGGLVTGAVLLTIVSMLGAYAATALLAPFSAAGLTVLYADQRIRHEAFDVELTRARRTGTPVGAG